ncbi:hypothetical protein RND81_07G009800 [Saponaria officinalis]|uniref:Transmembrane protein n=1 Tax=Saponaria officinalis TaxID=3572 RepID=A0AAW1JMF9_SAPOF
MEWKLRQMKEDIRKSVGLLIVQPIHMFSITLLSLLLPLSFLLLARLSTAHYLLSLTSLTPPKTFLFSLFLHTNTNLLHVLVLVVSLAALIHALTGRISLLTELPGPISRPHVHLAWMFLCSLQLCVGLGVEATIEAGVNGPAFGVGRSVISKLVFFMGLHETMIHWCRTIVRPIVNDTVYGHHRQETWPERWALAACYGLLSWWRLRGEVDSLVIVMEVKRDMMIKVGLGDCIGFVLYYLTVAIGMSKIVKGVMWFCMNFFWRRLVDDHLDDDHDLELEDKFDDPSFV